MLLVAAPYPAGLFWPIYQACPCSGVSGVISVLPAALLPILLVQ